MKHSCRLSHIVHRRLFQWFVQRRPSQSTPNDGFKGLYGTRAVTEPPEPASSADGRGVCGFAGRGKRAGRALRRSVGRPPHSEPSGGRYQAGCGCAASGCHSRALAASVALGTAAATPRCASRPIQPRLQPRTANHKHTPVPTYRVHRWPHFSEQPHFTFDYSLYFPPHFAPLAFHPSLLPLPSSSTCPRLCCLRWSSSSPCSTARWPLQ